MEVSTLTIGKKLYGSSVLFFFFCKRYHLNTRGDGKLSTPRPRHDDTIVLLHDTYRDLLIFSGTDSVDPVLFYHQIGKY